MTSRIPNKKPTVTVPRTTERTDHRESTLEKKGTYDANKKVWTGTARGNTRRDASIATEGARVRDADISGFTDKFGSVTSFVTRAAKALGIDETWSNGFDNTTRDTLFENEHGSITTRVGTSGNESLTIDGDGIRGQFDRRAEAGIDVGFAGAAEGDWGSASGEVSARAEAVAEASGEATIDENGLVATGTVGARAGVYVDASGRYETPSITVGGQELSVAVDATARASAEVRAEATGSLTITRDPPEAMLRGEAGISAVAKAEIEGTVTAGPFEFVGSAYASAGAEASVSGVLGYADGKFSVGFSAGAALGLGAGFDVGITVDVEQIGEIAVGVARDVADQNGDGRIGFDDIGAGVQNAGRAVGNAAQAVGNTVNVAAQAVGNTISNAAATVRSWLPW